MALTFPMIRNCFPCFTICDTNSEQGKGRIGYDDVRLFQQIHALLAAEVAIALEILRLLILRSAVIDAIEGLLALIGLK